MKEKIGKPLKWVILTEFHCKIKYESVYYREYWKISIEKFFVTWFIEKRNSKWEKKCENKCSNRSEDNIFLSSLIGRLRDYLIDKIDGQHKAQEGCLKKPWKNLPNAQHELFTREESWEFHNKKVRKSKL